MNSVFIVLSVCSIDDILSVIFAEVVNELYLKMLKSVEGRTMPPNALLWSLVENCANREDIKLLFQILQNLRRFVSYISTF